MCSVCVLLGGGLLFLRMSISPLQAGIDGIYIPPSAARSGLKFQL
jgi:hypothetical protein